MTPAERMAASIEVVDGCHVWTKARNGKGYGVIWFEGKLHLAHRVAWRLEHGDWPPAGLVLDHFVCSRPSCCNPAHLVATSNGANIMRAIPRGTPEVEARRAASRAAQARCRARKASR